MKKKRNLQGKLRYLRLALIQKRKQQTESNVYKTN